MHEVQKIEYFLRAFINLSQFIYQQKRANPPLFHRRQTFKSVQKIILGVLRSSRRRQFSIIK